MHGLLRQFRIIFVSPSASKCLQGPPSLHTKPGAHPGAVERGGPPLGLLHGLWMILTIKQLPRCSVVTCCRSLGTCLIITFWHPCSHPAVTLWPLPPIHSLTSTCFLGAHGSFWFSAHAMWGWCGVCHATVSALQQQDDLLASFRAGSLLSCTILSTPFSVRSVKEGFWKASYNGFNVRTELQGKRVFTFACSCLTPFLPVPNFSLPLSRKRRKEIPSGWSFPLSNHLHFRPKRYPLCSQAVQWSPSPQALGDVRLSKLGGETRTSGVDYVHFYCPRRNSLSRNYHCH